MMKITNGKVIYDWVDITDRQILHYVTADGKKFLRPTREEWNRIDCVDENEGLFEVYFHWELDCIVRGKKFAEWYLQQLIDEEDYYNWNEKDYWEFEF